VAESRYIQPWHNQSRSIMALKAHLRMNMHLTNRWARWTGEQGRWWLTLRGTQLMTSYDVAARQSTTGCYRQFRLPQARKQWPDMLLRSHQPHSILTGSSSLFGAVKCYMYRLFYHALYWRLESWLPILCYTVSHKHDPFVYFLNNAYKMNQLR